MRLIRWALCAAIAATAVACGESEKPSTSPPAPAVPPPAAPPAAQPAPPAPPPPAAPAQPTADTASGDPVARGAVTYKTYCATCHGEDGCTAGPGAAGLNPQPAHHCDGNYMNKLTDEHLFKTVKEGGASVGKSPMMAPWGGTLTDDQIHDVVAFVRSLAKPPYPGHPTK
jgi:cytochrome c oxidase cbb3-type subunit 3